MKKFAVAVLIISSLVYAEENQPQVEKNKSNLQLGALYSMASSMVMSGTAGSVPLNQTDTSAATLGFLVETTFKNTEQNRFYGGASYELDRKFTSYSGTLGTGTYTTQPSLSIFNFYMDAALKYDGKNEIYAGLSYPIPTLSNSVLTAKGALSYQIGVNIPTQNGAANIEYRFLNATASGNSLGTQLNVTTGTFNGLILAYKFNM